MAIEAPAGEPANAIGSRGALLCVANFPANTGYAWNFIESQFAGLAEHLAAIGIRTLVAYPSDAQSPRSLQGSTAVPVQLDASLQTAQSVRRTFAFIRRNDVRALYLVDRPARAMAYALMRAAGVRCIIVHDHTSGERTRPRGPKRLVKWVLARLPVVTADLVIAVSNYVARRQVEIALVPPERVVQVANSVQAPAPRPGPAAGRHTRAWPDAERPVVFSACRATPEKGVAHLLRAFDALLQRWPSGRPRPALVYAGDGPQMAELQLIRESLAAKDDIYLEGYVPDAADLMEGAAVCVVPSVWDEAFCLVVLEAMVRGCPVVATRVGAIPELIEDGVRGLLVPRGDEAAMSAAIERLLLDRPYAEQLARSAGAFALEHYNPEHQMEALSRTVEAALHRKKL